MKKHIHFIAIGGSAMHNLAIALSQKGYRVTGSDDHIFEPSRSRLSKHNLLPPETGWFPEKIDSNTEIVILGMHAKADNPELIKARALNRTIYSYPQFIYNECINKKRIVIAGSHGKTTVTSMLMHALKTKNITFDYLVGAQLEGFDTMANLSNESEIAIFEGDEYFASPLDLRPKFLWYKPHLALITGIAWDHVNVFPTFESYKKTFSDFMESIPTDGFLTWQCDDNLLNKMAIEYGKHLRKEGYSCLTYQNKDETTSISYRDKVFEVPIFGKHNIQNMTGALTIWEQLNYSAEDFLHAMRSFKGADRRLQKLASPKNTTVYYDFAHAPSKLKATVEAVYERHPNQPISACLELHTFSSLTKNFLKQYENTMRPAHKKLIYYNPKVVAQKGLESISIEEMAHAFNINLEEVTTNKDDVAMFIRNETKENNILLIMSSGNFGGLDIKSTVQS